MKLNSAGFSSNPDYPLVKETSLYYELLVSRMGQEKADFIWDNRNRLQNNDEDDLYRIWQRVKGYKPENKLNIIGDLNWGFNSILDNERRK